MFGGLAFRNIWVLASGSDSTVYARERGERDAWAEGALALEGSLRHKTNGHLFGKRSVEKRFSFRDK